MFLLAQTAESDEEFWRVTADQARCLIDNVDAYIASGAEIVVIPIETCPYPSLSVENLDGLSNYGGVSKIQTKRSPSGYDDVISYTAKDLACLDRSKVRIEDESAYLPKFLNCSSHARE